MPYTPPVQFNSMSDDSPAMESVRKGQKLLMIGLLAIILANVASFINNRIAPMDEDGVIPITFALLALGLLAVWLVGVVMGVIGLIKMSRGMGYHVGLVVILCFLIFIPLVNIIALAILNAKATARLRDSGYSVGFLGAGPKSA